MKLSRTSIDIVKQFQRSVVNSTYSVMVRRQIHGRLYLVNFLLCVS